MPKTVVFIEPIGAYTNVFDDAMRLPLMDPLILGTILHNAGHRVRVLNESVLGSRIDPIAIRADWVYLSALTPNANRVKTLARQFKQSYPNTRVVMGGTHATILPTEFTEFADHVIQGEAEAVICDLIEGDIDDRLIEGESVQDMDALPLMNFDLLENHAAMDLIPIMTSRGCTADCPACTVPQAYGRTLRHQSVARVMAEIRNALPHFRTRDVFFYDHSLTADLAYARALFAELKNAELHLTWSARLRSDSALPSEMLEAMRRAGCTRVHVDFTSILSPAGEDGTPAPAWTDLRETIRAFHAAGINVHGMFTFGHDHDTLEVVDQAVTFSVENEVDTVQLTVLTPFPGTQAFADLQAAGRIFHQNWDFYNGMYTVFQPARMSPIALQEAVEQAYGRFYSVRRTCLDVLRLIPNLALDALVLNLNRVFRYDLVTIALRLGARRVIDHYSRTNRNYVQFLETLSACGSQA